MRTRRRALPPLPHHVRRPPRSKPVLLWDGDCGFCKRWVLRVKRLTGPRVRFVPYQKAVGRFPEIPLEHHRRQVHFITTGGRVYPAGEGAARALSRAPKWRWVWTLYRIPPFGMLIRAAYRTVAANRGFFDWWEKRLAKLFARGRSHRA